MSEQIGEVAEKSSRGASNMLTKKIGPLPGWAWFALIGILVIAVFMRQRNSAPRASANYVADVVPDSTGIAGAGPGTVPQSTYDGINLTSNGRPLVQDNGSWAMLASNALVSRGKHSASDVSNALDKYLSGKPLTQAEAAIVNLAIQEYGQPPSGVLGINIIQPKPVAKPTPKPVVKPAPKPVAKPTPKPVAKPKPVVKPKPKPVAKPAAPSGSWYTVKRGDNLSVIAARFYGRQDWQKLWADAGNKKRIGTGNPNLIHPGTRLWIPKK